MDQLKRNRKTARSNTTRFQNYLNNLNPNDVNEIQLEDRLNTYMPTLELFNKGKNDEEETEEEERHEEAEITEFENNYFDLISKAKMLLRQADQTTVSGPVNQLLRLTSPTSTLSVTAAQKCEEAQRRTDNFETFLNNEGPEFKDSTMLELRLSNYQPTLEYFNNAFIENDTATAEEQSQFENRYFDLTARARSALIRFKEIKQLEAKRGTEIRLPPINFPEFDGKLEDWTTFKSTFQAIINDSDGLSEIRKLKYLISSLKGEASNTISSLPLTTENYNVAWQQLEARYENKKLIIETHLNALFDMPRVNPNSPSSLREHLNTFTKNIRALEVLGEPTLNTILVYLSTRCLDYITKDKWEEHRVKTNNPTREQLITFLEERCQVLNSRQVKPESKAEPTNQRPVYNPRRLTAAATNWRVKCPMCQGDHFLNQCLQYKALSIPERLNYVNSSKRCTNCLGLHELSQCTSSYCQCCGQKHHTTLHQDNVTQVCSASLNHEPNVILSTAVVMATNKWGHSIPVRVFLDNGSQPNLITLHLAKRLQLKTSNYNNTVFAANQGQINIKGQVTTTIKSRLNNFNIAATFLIVNKIVNDIPTSPINRALLNIPENIRLADPDFDQSRPVDMLLGSEYFWNLLCVGQLKLTDSTRSPILQKTHFGWIVGGAANHAPRTQTVNHISITNDELDQNLERFWNLEDVSVPRMMTGTETWCEQHFQNTHRRNTDGRYVVQLPLKSNPDQTLGDSRASALQRFKKLEERLQSKPELKQTYKEFMDEYIQLGHMKLLLNEDIEHTAFYLPHHCVLRPDSATTKLRVVFDGSAKSTSGQSVNDLMHVGPTIQQDLTSIVLRFRLHRVVITGDLTKMYRQIQVDPSQTHLQRILWRDDPQQPIQAYELLTVTYGTTSAPYLATKALQQLAKDEENNFPLASPIAQRDFYVDDLLTGTDNLHSAIALRDQLRQLLSAGGFEIRKWASNDQRLLDGLPEETISYKLPFDKNENLKPLGLEWSPAFDTLQYSITSFPENKRVTKRTILSNIASIFDPLGLVGPVIVTTKIMMQTLWKLGVTWDEAVPQDLNTKWLQFAKELTLLQKIRIQRRIINNDGNITNLELIGYCDASETAYGACIYAVTKDNNDQVSSHLIMAKSRVAPVKKVSLPRLELCGAVVLARLVHKICNAIETQPPIRLCTDSTVVLCWIKSHKLWKTFIANRVTEIHQLTNPNDWGHVPSNKNPADILSRGCLPSELLSKSLWWHGPTWTLCDINQWKMESEFEQIDTNSLEERICHNITAATTNQSVYNDLIPRYSSMNRLLRVTSYVNRFVHNTRATSTDARTSGPLNRTELKQSEQLLVLCCQQKHFANEIRCLKTNQPLSNKSKLLRLNPFIDAHGLIRVGGRLHKAAIPEDHKFPIVLPSKDALTVLLIQHEHLRHLHAGAQLTLAGLRQQYWPLLGRKVVHNVLSKCLICFRAAPTSITPIMGNLPLSRVQPARPFSICGVDYAGPFSLRQGGSRSRTITKAYAAVFICMSTKAVHLELVSALTTDAFINTLHRFVSRRGMVHQLYSDNATNFVGAKNEFERIMNSETFHDAIQNYKIEWHNIPPRSPHMGGLWEAAVRSMKRHILRVVGETILNFEEMTTLLTRIEAVLNSRPIIQLSNDPNDYSCLTPGHFLVGEPLTALPQEILTDIPSNRLSRWQHITYMHQHFWKRWANEYLHTLQERKKWFQQSTRSIQCGDLVLLKDDQLPPLKWNLGRVEILHPGDDGVVRAVSVRTPKGLFKRAVVNVCPLPNDS